MQVAVNGRFLTQAVTGVQRHARETLRAVDRLRRAGAAADDWVVLAPPGARLDLPLETIEVRTAGRRGGHAWEQLELPRLARGRLLVGLANTGPLAHPRQLVTIHDASVFAVPEAYSAGFRLWYRTLLPLLGRRARLVATDSRFSAEELARRAGIPRDRLRVVPLGAEHATAVAADRGVFDRLELGGRPFVLTVGSRSPHKNFALLRRTAPELDRLGCAVVVAGGGNARVFGAPEHETAGPLRYAGYVTDGELRALYEAATCFVYPSRYEGFGLPPLEAMACGCPVAVARAASLPEVCGDAAAYFDPDDPAGLVAAVAAIVGDPARADALRAAGRARSAEFTWDRTARRLLELVGELAEG